MFERINQKYLNGLWLTILIFPFYIFGQDTTAAKILPSMVTLTIQKSDGSTQTENGFLTIRDGIVATALHVVKDAKRVTAHFSAGDEYECTGIIDKDEVRDVALVRIKVFGKPMVKMIAIDTAVGAALSLAAVKDSAFGMVRVTVAESAARDGTKWVRLDGEIPPGNSGSPISDEQGNIIGMLTFKKVDEKVVSYLIPSGFILALDNTLPTKPWDQTVVASTPGSTTPGAAERMANRQLPNLSNEEIDKLIGKALFAIVDNITAYQITSATYLGLYIGAPSPNYEEQVNLNLAFSKLVEARTTDQLRAKITGSLLPIMKAQLEASDSLIKVLVTAQQLQTYAGQPGDMWQRSAAQQKMVSKMMTEMIPDLLALEKDSAKFREFLPKEQRLKLGLLPPYSGFRLGIFNSVAKPFYFFHVDQGGLAEKIGLKRGDKIISLAGNTFTENDCIEDLKMIIKQNLGKKLEAMVEREGKVMSLKLVIPAVLPASAIYQ